MPTIKPKTRQLIDKNYNSSELLMKELFILANYSMLFFFVSHTNCSAGFSSIVSIKFVILLNLFGRLSTQGFFLLQTSIYRMVKDLLNFSNRHKLER